MKKITILILTCLSLLLSTPANAASHNTFMSKTALKDIQNNTFSFKGIRPGSSYYQVKQKLGKTADIVFFKDANNKYIAAEAKYYRNNITVRLKSKSLNGTRTMNALVVQSITYTVQRTDLSPFKVQKIVGKHISSQMSNQPSPFPLLSRSYDKNWHLIIQYGKIDNKWTATSITVNE